jgi:hypothetical protein
LIVTMQCRLRETASNKLATFNPNRVKFLFGFLFTIGRLLMRFLITVCAS